LWMFGFKAASLVPTASFHGDMTACLAHAVGRAGAVMSLQGGERPVRVGQHVDAALRADQDGDIARVSRFRSNFRGFQNRGGVIEKCSHTELIGTGRPGLRKKSGVSARHGYILLHHCDANRLRLQSGRNLLVPRRLRTAVLVLSLTAVHGPWLRAEPDTGWRISPENINIQAGDQRRLQLLDDSAQELQGAEWSVDDSSLAEIHEELGSIVFYAKAVGAVRVRAVLGGETRFREIHIWPAEEPLPPGTTHWGSIRSAGILNNCRPFPHWGHRNCTR
jgi:hypothetical protein